MGPSYHKIERIVVESRANGQLGHSATRWIDSSKNVARCRARRIEWPLEKFLNFRTWEAWDKVVLDDACKLLDGRRRIRRVKHLVALCLALGEPMGRLLDMVA